MRLVEVPEPGAPHAHVFHVSVPTEVRAEFREMIDAQLSRDGLRAPNELTWVAGCLFCAALELTFGYAGEADSFTIVLTRPAS